MLQSLFFTVKRYYAIAVWFKFSKTNENQTQEALTKLFYGHLTQNSEKVLLDIFM